MKILLFGNIGSGKTSISRRLLTEFPTFEYLAIDEFRKKYGDGTKKKEEEAKELFLNAIQTDDTPQIIESTGLGKLGEAIYDKLISCNDYVLVVVLQVEVPVLVERLQMREWDIPFPTRKVPLAKLLELSDKALAGLLERWYHRLNCTIYAPDNYTNEQQDLNFNMIQTFVRSYLSFSKNKKPIRQ